MRHWLAGVLRGMAELLSEDLLLKTVARVKDEAVIQQALAERRAEEARDRASRAEARYDEMKGGLHSYKQRIEAHMLLIDTLRANGKADDICRQLIEFAWEQGIAMDLPLFRQVEEQAGTGGGREAKEAAWRYLRDTKREMGGKVEAVEAFHIETPPDPLLED